MVKRSAAGF
jgi:hypothetical protein